MAGSLRAVAAPTGLTGAQVVRGAAEPLVESTGLKVAMGGRMTNMPTAASAAVLQ